MKLLRGIAFLLVFSTAVLLVQGRRDAADKKKAGKQNRRKEEKDAAQGDVAIPDTDPVVVPGPQLPAAGGDPQVQTDVTPSLAHNGKLNKGDKEARKARKKAARKAAKKAEKQAARKAARKAAKKEQKKAQKKLRKQEEKKRHYIQKLIDRGVSQEDAERMAIEKEQRQMERRKLKHQQQQHQAEGEIVSFTDIVEGRQKDPNPNPLPPVVGDTPANDTATENHDNAAGGKHTKAEKRRLRKEEKARMKLEKQAQKQRKRNKEVATCDECGKGTCCVEKHGKKMCKRSRKQEGQKCLADCMCRAGLSCIEEEIAPGKGRRFCRVPGVPELDIGNDVGAVEDAVENILGGDQ